MIRIAIALLMTQEKIVISLFGHSYYLTVKVYHFKSKQMIKPLLIKSIALLSVQFKV